MQSDDLTDIDKQRMWDKTITDTDSYSSKFSVTIQRAHKALPAAVVTHSGYWLHTLLVSACGFHLCRYDFVNLQSSLDRILDWSNEHQLPISVKKCSCIVLGNTLTSDVHYSIDGQPVNTVTEVRDLGVIVDSSLKFNSHINYIVAKANSRASLIYGRPM